MQKFNAFGRGLNQEFLRYVKAFYAFNSIVYEDQQPRNPVKKSRFELNSIKYYDQKSYFFLFWLSHQNLWGTFQKLRTLKFGTK